MRNLVRPRMARLLDPVAFVAFAARMTRAARGGPVTRGGLLALLVLGGTAGAVLPLRAQDPATEETESQLQQVGSPADLLSNNLYVSVGWAYGISSRAFSVSEAEAVGEASDSDAEPLVNLTGIVGDTAWFALETKAILGNFGRLVEVTGLDSELDDPAPSEPELARSSVRRALITDVTFRFAPRWIRGQRVGMELLFNTGFIFDGGGDTGLEAVNDAASYWFVGASWNGHFDSPGTFMIADVLFGKSELLTGVEPFSDGGPWRVRPRLRFRIPGVSRAEKLDIGFWADIGVQENTPDAVTVYAAIPVLGGGT